MTPFRRHRLLAVVLTASLGLAGCVAPQHAAEVDRFHQAVADTRDSDRTKAARVTAGLDAAATGVGLACTMVKDSATIPLFAPLRRFCERRRGPS